MYRVDLVSLSLACLGLFIAGIIKGASGIGYSTAALPFLVLAVGLKPAMALVIAPAIASNLAVMIGSGNIAPIAARFAPFYLATIPGIAGGTIALTLIDVSLATKGLGAITLAYVALALAKPGLRLPARLERPLTVPAGLMNGVVTGLTGSQIMPLMPFMLALGLRPAEQVQAINLAVTVASCVLAMAMLQTGLATTHLLALSVIGILPAILGVSVGARLRSALSESAFKRLTLYVLAFIAASLILNSAPTPRGECSEAVASAADAGRPTTSRTTCSADRA
jgi:uncharacterized membrane protein YfcA